MIDVGDKVKNIRYTCLSTGVVVSCVDKSDAYIVKLDDSDVHDYPFLTFVLGEVIMYRKDIEKCE